MGLAALLLVLSVASCKPADAPEATKNAAANVKVTTTDIAVGTGTVAEKGDEVWVVYSGSLKDGAVFDSNTGEDKDPFQFKIGEGTVIKGWDQGVPGMKVGGKRKLHVPASLGYGDTGSGEKIPPKADLDFEVTLLYVQKPSDDPFTYEKEDIKPGSGPEVKEGDTVVFDYKAQYVNGKVFDDSEHRPTKSSPITVKVGSGAMVKGVDFAIRGMKPGGERVVTMAPKLLFNGFGSSTLRGNQPSKWTFKMISVNGSKG
jgi:peptidylprolyl isomerase